MPIDPLLGQARSEQLSPLTITGIDLPSTLRYEGFAGEPEDQAVTSQEGTLSGNQLVMPPYSFRVFEW